MSFLALIVFFVAFYVGIKVLELFKDHFSICELHDWIKTEKGMRCSICKIKPGDNFEK